MSRIVKVATTVVIVLATAVALSGLFLAFVGMPTTLVQEKNPFEGTGGEKTIIRYTVPHALLGTLSAVIIIGGLLTRKQLIAWIGLAFLFAYSTLFLFSVGVGLLPVAVVLLVLLVMVQHG
jgi:hypothetical protein